MSPPDALSVHCPPSSLEYSSSATVRQYSGADAETVNTSISSPRRRLSATSTSGGTEVWYVDDAVVVVAKVDQRIGPGTGEGRSDGHRHDRGDHAERQSTGHEARRGKGSAGPHRVASAGEQKLVLQRKEHGTGDHHGCGRGDVTVGAGCERGDPDEQRDARRDCADGGVTTEREMVGEGGHDPHRDHREQDRAGVGWHRRRLVAQDPEAVVETITELVECGAGRESELRARRREYPDREEREAEGPRAHRHKYWTSAREQADDVRHDRRREHRREPRVAREDPGEPSGDRRAQRGKRDGRDEVSA